MVYPDKATLRQEMIKARLSFSKSQHLLADQKITEHLCAFFGKSSFKKIALYMPVKGEVDTKPTISYLQAQGLTVLLPLVHQKERMLSFHQYECEADLKKGAYGILEPDEMAPEVLPDCVITPGLAFAKRGGRLGYGGGYYDRTLSKVKMKKDIKIIGLCYDFQCLEYLELQPHDVLCDMVVTEQNIYEVI